MHTVSALVNWG